MIRVVPSASADYVAYATPAAAPSPMRRGKYKFLKNIYPVPKFLFDIISCFGKV